MKSRKIGIIGAGSWGTALAISLADKGHQVRIWDIDTEHVKAMAGDGENKRYLPGISFGENLKVMTDKKETLKNADVVLFSVPAQYFRGALIDSKAYIPEGAVIVNVAKGIEQKSLMTISQIAAELAPEWEYAVLSGPSHAEEVGKKLPTTVVVASQKSHIANMVQDVFMTSRLRVYTSKDVMGVELGGALKNIIALGAGISDGIGFGDNAKAALMTRGMAEITRLGIALGAEAETFAGLAGVGDLIVTCTSVHSRNRRCGIMIGKGVSPEQAVKEVGMVVEGMFTASAAYQLAKQVGVEMPITEQICKVIKGKVDPQLAVEILMGRERKHEQE